jgi:hypothetical protein
MATYSSAIYRIADFVRWNRKDQLILQPKFQRRAVWEPAARSYLIDTIVRDLPMPKVYVRKVVSPKTKLTAYEAVDGQQRLRAILDFFDGELILSKRHNADLGDATFSTLPEPMQRSFLDYDISTEVMERASDPEVWAMFERLNTYTLTLNRQERLNARWFGYFKQTAYTLAAQESALEAWRRLKVFGNRQIARMKEVELTSDVLVAIVDGISDITYIAEAYAEYDKDFPKHSVAAKSFRSSLTWIVNELEEVVSVTKFKSRAWFYSLAVAVCDMLNGIPDGLGPTRPCSTREIQSRMLAMDAVFKTTELFNLPKGFATLSGALSRGTSHIPERRVRHDFFVGLLTLSDKKWNQMQQGKLSLF